MILAEDCFLSCINSPVRHVRARVELYNGSTLLQTFKDTDRLKEITIERVGEENKFFGFGVCQKLNIKLIDIHKELDITTDNSFDVAFGTGCDFVYASPIFYTTYTTRDENTNELSITAYDALYKATNYTVEQLHLPERYTIRDVALYAATLLGLPLYIDDSLTEVFSLDYNAGANFEGGESVRNALNAIAEATQTIYYVDSEWRLVFKRMDMTGEPVYNITKERYFTLKNGTNRRLNAICSATELGDNVIASLDITGTTQFVRDNPFWELRPDIATLVDNALTAVGGFTLNQFDCNWRGNYLIEIGDKIALETKEGNTVYSYLLDDIVKYDGSYSQQTRWNYTNNDNETASNPTSLGDAIHQTYAKVDKANKEISMVVSESANNKDKISSLMLNTDSISASVENLKNETVEMINGVNGEIRTISNKVEAAMTADAVSIAIKEELTNGVDKVITKTGFIFNDEGLNISKTGSEMTTQITEDGMTVSRDNQVVLTANNIGVEAINLYATTFLIIGTHSRLEDFDGKTACFWIK